MSEYVPPTPPGWPREVKPPGLPGWERSVIDWLSPMGYGIDALRREHALLLARETRLGLEARQRMLREAYRTARYDLTDRVGDEAISTLRRSYLEEGEALPELIRRVDLVQQALEGTRWRVTRPAAE